MRVMDFSRISDREFEVLCSEVLSMKLGISVKQGRSGPDRGIDGSFYLDGCPGGVMQAKHYVSSGPRALITRLKNVEVQKAKSTNATRYVLMTSCSLNVRDRNAILGIFHGIIQNSDDVFSGDDICSLLDSPTYEWIKKKHYNLWLSDIVSLECYCGDGVHSKSKAMLDDIREDLKFAVETWAFVGAKSKLFHDNVLIITGQAGCGKTTLAKQLVADTVFKYGYSLVVSDFELSTFERQLEMHPARKTIFLLDDFLGMNILSVLNENRDSQIVSFIRRIRRSDKFKLILTSRTYIVNEAVARSYKLADAKVSRYIYELSDNKMTRIDRANIVYSHLYHGDVSEKYKASVYAHENYFKLIDHRNFNPRIISYCFDVTKSQLHDEGEEFVLAHILKLLDNPEQIWRDCLDRLNDLQLQIVIIVFLAVSSHGKAVEICVKNAIRRLQLMDRFLKYQTCAIDNLLKDLCGSVLSRSVVIKRGEETASYTLFNPSIGDYIIATYGENSQLLADGVLALEDSKVALDMYFKEIWHRSSERYVKTCKVAFETVTHKLEENVSKFSPDFVLGLIGELSEYKSIGNDFVGRIARACWNSGVCFSPSASASLVAYYFNRMLDSRIVDIADNRLTKEYLGMLLGRLTDCVSLLKLKRVYDFIGEAAPVVLYESLRKHGNDWAYTIASESSFDDDDTEMGIYEYVHECMSEAFLDFEIDEDFVSVDECIDGCDFSDYVRNADDDEPDWRDWRAKSDYSRDAENEQIRSIFRREI